MERPQRLGFLPTLWFWESWGMERPLVNGLLGMLMGASGVLVCHLLLALDYPLAAILGAPCVPLIGYGLIERALRRAVLHRRRALLAPPAIGSGEDPPHEDTCPPPPQQARDGDAQTAGRGRFGGL